jgi:hypothetical protein
MTTQTTFGPYTLDQVRDCHDIIEDFIAGKAGDQTKITQGTRAAMVIRIIQWVEQHIEAVMETDRYEALIAKRDDDGYTRGQFEGFVELLNNMILFHADGEDLNFEQADLFLTGWYDVSGFDREMLKNGTFFFSYTEIIGRAIRAFDTEENNGAYEAYEAVQVPFIDCAWPSVGLGQMKEETAALVAEIIAQHAA